MLRIVRCSFYAVLVSMLVTGIQAFATGATAPSKAPVARPGVKPRAGMSAKVPRTPYERIFAPGLARMHGASAGTAFKSALFVRPADAGVPSPNFAGYPSGSLYPPPCSPADLATDLCNSSAIVSADFNQDGKADVAFVAYHIEADFSLGLAVFAELGDGKGGLGKPIISGGEGTPRFIYVYGKPIVVDMNGDGYPDIVVQTNNPNIDDAYNVFQVYIYTNQKDGTFSGPKLAATVPGENVIPQHTGGQFYSAISVGDVNGDGRPDLVIAGVLENGSGAPYNFLVSTFLANADGTFADPTLGGTSNPLYQQIALPAGLDFPEIALADMNGDGHLDLALQLAHFDGLLQVVSTTTQVFPGHGDGSFADIVTGGTLVFSLSKPTTGQYNGGDPSALLVGDLNKDGAPDIVMVFSLGTYSALGNGDGTFQQPVLTPEPQTDGGDAMLADMNGDGFPDLLLFSAYDAAIYLGTGNGAFNAKGSFALDTVGYSGVADFNGDGKLDVVTGGDNGGHSESINLSDLDFMILNGQGDGTLLAPHYLTGDTTPSTSPYAFQLMAAGDLNGDGYTDVILHDSENPVFFNNPAADQNHLVSALSDGKGNFTYMYALPFSATANLGYIEPTTADFNGDGRQDILFVGLDNSLSVALSRGDGTFADPISIGLPSLQCEVTYSVAGDLNGDGKLDIVAPYPGDKSCGKSGSTPSGYFVALGHGDGTFATPVFTAMCAELYSAALADFNGDGKLDLVLNDTPYNVPGRFDVSLALGRGDGSFAPATSIAMDAMVSQVLIGDFNQDGKLDLVLLSAGTQPFKSTDYSTAGVLLFAGKGDGTFAASTLIEPGNYFSSGFLRDVNGDGIPDLTLAQTNFDPSVAPFYGLATLLGTGDGSFAAPLSNYLSSVTPFQHLNDPITDYTVLLPGNFYADNAPDFVAGTIFGPLLYLGLGGDTLNLSASTASIDAGGSLSLAAVVTPSMPHRPVPTGQVSFYDGSTLLGQATLDGSGSASFSTSVLAVGSHTITATYSGDGNTNANSATAGSVTVTALAPAFTVSANPSSLTITQGQSGTATLTVTTNAAYSGTVKFSCGGLPANASCTFTPASLQLGASQTASETMLVSTTAPSTNTQVKLMGLAGSFAGMAATGLLLLVVPLRRRWAKAVVLIAVLTLTLGTLGIVSGCGSGSKMATSPAVPGTPMGTTTVKVTVVDSASSSSQTATITLVIQ